MSIQSFSCVDMQVLLETGKSARFANIKKVAERKLVQRDAAPSLNFMKTPPGHDLKGYDGAWHVRINGQWRLTFKWGNSGPFDVLIEDPHEAPVCVLVVMEFIMFKNRMRPIHPGEILLENYIKPMGTRVRALSQALHVPCSGLRDIVDGNRGVSADTALRLERYFGSEAQGWLNLQAAYERRVAEKLSAKGIFKEITPLQRAARPRVNGINCAAAQFACPSV